MGFIRDLFKKKKIDESAEKTSEKNEYIIQLFKLQEFMDGLLLSNRYIAKRKYVSQISDYGPVVDYFKVLDSSGMLEPFCSQNGMKAYEIKQCIERYTRFENYVEEHNEDFIVRTMETDKEYMDNILKAVDPQILLDEDQRRVILTDEDYCLVIAGAGAGKTTTVAAKVKYLVERNKIDPSQILVVSFTNKAVNE